MEDRWTMRMVVAGLAALGVLVVLGGISLSFVGRDVPEALVAIGSGAVGALGGILTRSPLESERPAVTMPTPTAP
jgi:drug/metabolite transporter (DMT)-like permease